MDPGQRQLEFASKFLGTKFPKTWKSTPNDKVLQAELDFSNRQDAADQNSDFDY